MCDQEKLEAEDRQLEARLHRLIPSSPRLQRDAVMFEAGRRSLRRQLRLWQGASTALLAGAVFVGTLLLDRPPISEARALPPMPPPNFATPPAPVHVALKPSGPAGLATAHDYLRWRSRLVMEGVDALPNPPSCAALPDPLEFSARRSPNAAAGLAPRLPVFTLQGKGNRL